MEENNNNINILNPSHDDRLSFEIKRALLNQTAEPDTEQAFRDFMKRNHLKPKTKRPLWYSIIGFAAAACVAALLILSPWKDSNKGSSNQAYKQLAQMGDVVYHASEDRNYITLSFGEREVPISDKASAADAGIIMTKDNIIRVFDHQTENHDEVSISVPAGQIAKVMLDDSTLVSINAGSKLTFPHHFRTTGMREVKLYGEAYFEVRHDETRPFIVNTEGMRTKVLGTKFDVKYFQHERNHVTLTEGSVEVRTPNAQVYLKPQETAWLQADNQLNVEPSDMEQALSWINGEFYFDGQTLRDIMTEIGRWYNYNVIFANGSHLQEQLHFSAERTAPISEIVRQLQLIGNARIELKSKEQVLLIK